MQKEHWVYETDQGKWALVSPSMEAHLNSPDRKFLIGPGIHTAEVWPSLERPTHGILSHLSDGMSGERRWHQCNLQTGKCRLLKVITWQTDAEREAALNQPIPSTSKSGPALLPLNPAFFQRLLDRRRF